MLELVLTVLVLL